MLVIIFVSYRDSHAHAHTNTYVPTVKQYHSRTDAYELRKKLLFSFIVISSDWNTLLTSVQMLYKKQSLKELKITAFNSTIIFFLTHAVCQKSSYEDSFCFRNWKRKMMWCEVWSIRVCGCHPPCGSLAEKTVISWENMFISETRYLDLCWSSSFVNPHEESDYCTVNSPSL